MYCTKCGNYNKEENKYCEICGNEIKQFSERNQQSDVQNKIEQLKIITIIIGVFTIAMSLIFKVLIIPLSITGISLSIITITKTSQKTLSILSIIINIVAIILSIIFFINPPLNYKTAEIKIIEKKAGKNAINYIEEKYGFTAQIVKSTFEKDNSYYYKTPNPTGYATVELKYNDKNFEVYISGEEKTTDGTDDYQFDEISEAIIKLIETKTNIKPINYYIAYDEPYRNKHIKTLYDGNNIEEIIENQGLEILLEYANIPDLKYIKDSILSIFIDNSKKNIVLINYDSEESYNKSLNYTDFRENILNTTPQSIYSYREYAPIFKIIDAYQIAGDEIYSLTPFELKKHEDIYYSYPKVSDNQQEVTLTNTKISNINNWVDKGNSKHKDIHENVKQISNAYLVENVSSNIYFYIPINKIKDYEIDNIDIGIECNENYANKMLSENIVGEYVVFHVYFQNYCESSKQAKIFLMHSTAE